jgi:DNA-binding MarR family transcriptional regulator
VSQPSSPPITESSSARGGGSPAFLLAQVGAHAAGKFAERLSVINLSPPHAGILRVVQTSGGISQQSLAEHLRILPSRLVVLIDELEERDMIERRADPADRRSYALHLTNKGRDTMKAIGRVARDHQDALLASLSTQEGDLLASLLLRVADQQGLRPGVHPGFARLRAQRRATKSPGAPASEARVPKG